MLRQRSLKVLFITTAFVFLFPFILFANVQVMSDVSVKRPDILTIDIPSYPDQKDMPAVNFKHDLHTQAVDGDCAKCHDWKDEKIVFKFKRIQDEGVEDYMQFYHDNCLACHSEMPGKTGNKGPLEAQCRTCHNADSPQQASSWMPIEFDRSLHYVHEKSKDIPSKITSEQTNCNACHHSADMKTKKTFYEKGKESACVYCHKQDGGNDIRTLGQASHDSCVVCHLELAEKKVKAGPVDCAGCHTKENQDKIETVKEIPRLDRNQPDHVLLTGWDTLDGTEAENQKIIAQHMDAVPFNHKAHEAAGLSCKACHHESLDKCVSCHTNAGSEKGGYVNLAQAMHQASAQSSCIGCHNEKKMAKECAGCHAIMPQKAFKDNNCATCHTVDAKAAPIAVLMDKKESAQLAEKALTKAEYKTVDLNDIPETVVIKTIADKYQPANFPHRLVVDSIYKKVENNAMAKAFHGNDLAMCVGCHHNSPATMTPPKCASCHDVKPDLAAGKPGLMGAYHGQCITCHQEMEVKSVKATDCIKCHEKK